MWTAVGRATQQELAAGGSEKTTRSDLHLPGSLWLQCIEEAARGRGRNEETSGRLRRPPGERLRRRSPRGAVKLTVRCWAKLPLFAVGLNMRSVREREGVGVGRKEQKLVWHIPGVSKSEDIKLVGRGHLKPQDWVSAQSERAHTEEKSKGWALC